MYEHYVEKFHGDHRLKTNDLLTVLSNLTKLATSYLKQLFPSQSKQSRKFFSHNNFLFVFAPDFYDDALMRFHFNRLTYPPSFLRVVNYLIRYKSPAPSTIMIAKDSG